MSCIIDVKTGSLNKATRYQLAGYAILERERHPVDYDDEGHSYKLNGILVPSVTGIIHSVGLSGSGLSYASDESLWFGQQVHLMIDMFHRGVSSEYVFDPILDPYRDAYMKFMEEKNFVYEIGEMPWGSRIYGFAGKPDLVGSTNVDMGKGMNRYSLHLKKDGKYKLEIHDNHYRDEQVFLSALVVEQEKIREGIK